MLGFLNSRLSLWSRVGLVAACAAPPITLLLYLFIGQTISQARFTDLELKGAAYITQVWSATGSGGALALPTTGPNAGEDGRRFKAAQEEQAFAEAGKDRKISTGADLIQAAADGSNLTLDTELGSYYAMDAATTALPQLMSAVSVLASAPDANARALALGRVQAFEDAALRDLSQAMAHDLSGGARRALAWTPNRLSAAFAAVSRQPQDPALHAALMQEVDRAWRANQGQLVRLLQIRQARLYRRLLGNLGLVALALGLTAILAIITTRGLATRLRVLLHTMDRLNARDTSVHIPYLSDSNETGRIAATLQACKDGLIEAAEERRHAQEATAAVRDSEARYRMLADNSTDVILLYNLEPRIEYVSPSVRQWGYQPIEIIGKPAGFFVHPDDKAAIARRRTALLRGEPGGVVETRVRHADGRWIWIESSPALVRDEQGNMVGLLLAMRDIDQRRATDHALIDSEARYRMLADNSTDVILRYDVDGRIEYASPSVRQLGYTPEQYIGIVVGAYAHPDDKQKLAERRAAIFRGEPGTALEGRIRHADGHWVWVESNAAPIRDQNGLLIGIVSTLRDITTRKAAEQALIDSEARYRMLADNTTDIILRYDVDGRIEYVSPSARRMGYRAEDMLGLEISSFVHPEDMLQHAELSAGLRRGEPGATVQSRLRHADGHWVWFESQPAPILNDQGEVLGIVTVLRDITERKAAQTALVESEARYRILADNSTDIILSYGGDATTGYVSPSVRQLGYTPEAFVTMPHGSIVHPDDWAGIAQRSAAIFSGEPARTVEARVRHADGHWVWLESRPAPIFGADGAVVGIVSVLRDVSERKAAEGALQEVNAELTRIARASALGAFAASIAHEVNQPLAAAVTDGETSLRWLSAPEPNLERAARAINRATENARRASEVVGRLRSMVTKAEPQRIDFNLNQAISEVLSLTALESQRSNVIVQSKLAADEPVIRGDRIQIQQVILNLVLNAIEAVRDLPKGQRTISVRSSVAPDATVEVAVEDHGSGVSPEHADRIFDNLFTTKIGGTGLGLPISKSIVEAHNGRLWVEDAAPQGAVFKLQLPHGREGAAQTKRAAPV